MWGILVVRETQIVISEMAPRNGMKTVIIRAIFKNLSIYLSTCGRKSENIVTYIDQDTFFEIV